jgi:hypothetical protein
MAAMSDDSEQPSLPALAPVTVDGPSTVFRLSVRPSFELAQFLKDNPGGQLTVLLPGDPGYGDSGREMSGPAFAIRSWREDNYACPFCSRAFSVAYGNPPGQARGTHNVVTRCPSCDASVAVAVPSDVTPTDIQVKTS